MGAVSDLFSYVISKAAEDMFRAYLFQAKKGIAGKEISEKEQQEVWAILASLRHRLNTVTELPKMSQQERFEAFTQELANLSKQYGVAIHSTGGVAIDKIKEIRYDKDSTSGDLDYRAKWETVEEELANVK